MARRPSRLRAEHAPGVRLATAEGPASDQTRPGEAILFEHGGYRLDVSQDAIDADRFRGLVEEGERQARAGNAEQAASTFREALALWRGPALVDFAYEPFAQAEIARLDELRLAAIEARIDADLQCGRHSAVVSELEALVNEHPHREGFRRELMLALYRSGRQGDALEVYTDTRARLDADLGIEPTPELRELQLAILRQAPELGAPAPTIHDADGRARRRRWPLAVGLAAAAALALAAAAILLRPTRGSAAVHVVRNSVAVVDAETNEIVDDVVVGDYPGPVAAGNGSVWVGNIGDSTVTEIHGDTREAEFPASAQRPVDLAVTDDALWIANATDFATQPPTGGGTVVRSGLVAGSVDVTQVGPRGASDEMSTFVTSDGRDGVGGEREQPHGGEARPVDRPDTHARRRSRERRDCGGIRRRLGPRAEGGPRRAARHPNGARRGAHPGLGGPEEGCGW